MSTAADNHSGDIPATVMLLPSGFPVAAMPADAMSDRTRMDNAALLRRAAQHIMDAVSLVDVVGWPTTPSNSYRSAVMAHASAFHRRADALDKEKRHDKIG